MKLILKYYNENDIKCIGFDQTLKSMFYSFVMDIHWFFSLLLLHFSSFALEINIYRFLSVGRSFARIHLHNFVFAFNLRIIWKYHKMIFSIDCLSMFRCYWWQYVGIYSGHRKSLSLDTKTCITFQYTYISASIYRHFWQIFLFIKVYLKTVI